MYEAILKEKLSDSDLLRAFLFTIVIIPSAQPGYGLSLRQNSSERLVLLITVFIPNRYTTS